MAHTSDSWYVTANALLVNVRSALSGLAKVAEHAHISWRDGEAYDDWDDLTSRVYEILAARPIAADVKVGPRAFPLAPYDMRLPSYTEHSSVAVTTGDGSLLLFNRLLAGNGDFALAEAVPARLDGRLTDAAPLVLPIESVAWAVLWRLRDGSTELRDHVIAHP